jgi:hypothetical protein
LQAVLFRGVRLGLFPLLWSYREHRQKKRRNCWRAVHRRGGHRNPGPHVVQARHLQSGEAVIIVVGAIAILSLVTLSREIANGVAPNASLQTLGAVLIAVYKWALMLGPNVILGVNTTICASLLYKSGLVPRFITRMGLGGAALILVTGVLELFGTVPRVSIWGFILAFPIFAYEMTLAVWLIVKGFNSSVLVSRSGT